VNRAETGPNDDNLGRRKYDGEFVTFREVVDKFVTKEEYAAGMLQIRNDIGEMKGDLKVVLRNQMPPWFLPAALTIIAALAILAQHFWK
jgi:hypothetical protein